MTISSLIIFFAILFFLVVIHELGHFLFAKWTKMRVDEFAFGFPPRLFSKKVGETIYSFNLIPLGGYVKIFGENGLTEEERNSLSEKDKKSLFGSKKILPRLLVLSGGVIFNILGAVMLFTFTLMLGSNVYLSPEEVNKENLNSRKMILVDIDEKSPLKNTEINLGDEILNASVRNNFVSEDLTKDVLSSKTFSEFIQKHNDTKINISYINKSGEIKNLEVIPVSGIVEGKKIIGAKFADTIYKKFGFFEALPEAVKITFFQIIYIFSSLLELVKNLIFNNAKVEDNLSGPIGLAVLTSSVSQKGLDQIFSFAAMLSLSLAVFNILPIPALDGGRIVFVLLEAVTRKKVKAETEQLFHGVGFMLLLALMLFVSYFDIVKAFAM